MSVLSAVTQSSKQTRNEKNLTTGSQIVQFRIY